MRIRLVRWVWLDTLPGEATESYASDSMEDDRSPRCRISVTKYFYKDKESLRHCRGDFSLQMRYTIVAVIFSYNYTIIIHDVESANIYELTPPLTL